MPFETDAEPDLKDTSVNKITLTGPSTILPDVPYYAEDNQQGQALLKVWADMVKEILAQTDLSAGDQETYLNDALAFDRELAKHVKTREEWADYPKAYNPQSFQEVADQLGDFDLARFAKDACRQCRKPLLLAIRAF